jgi:predicted amino acid racemase
MFLEQTERSNPALVQQAILLHQQGAILPNTYLIDMDMVEANTKALAAAAKAHEIELFFMSKQFGRNPYLCQKIAQWGIPKAVVVDYQEAQVLMQHNIAIGHAGHLVQIPNALLPSFVSYGIDYLTLYSLEKLAAVDALAKQQNKVQKVLLRVIGQQDTIYEGQEAGILLADLEVFVQQAKAFSHVHIAGLTAFPCLLYNPASQQVEPTANAQTLSQAKQILLQLGYQNIVMNMPSVSCTESLPLLKKLGASQAEPGHALLGSTPWHASASLSERPAMVYVSEVSHQFGGNSYAYGGGYYRRGHLNNALVCSPGQPAQHTHVLQPEEASIDYHLALQGHHPVGSSVIMAFRSQIFVTRSLVALVEGVQKGNPKIVGIYNSQGQLASGGTS